MNRLTRRGIAHGLTELGLNWAIRKSRCTLGLTREAFMADIDDKRLGEGDRQVFRSMKTGEGLVEIKSGDELMALARRAKETHNGFLLNATEIMTPLRAKRVRALRVDHGCTWRGVAERCHKAWRDADWWPQWNQLAGMAVCEVAAVHFGEHYMDEAWNG